MHQEQRPPVVTKWSAIPDEEVRHGVRRRAFGTSEMILVMNEIAPEMQPSPHSHEGFDQIAYIVSGHATYTVGGVAHDVGPGSVLLIPAGTQHWIQPTGDVPVENLDVFAPARADYSHLLEWMSDFAR